MTRSWNELREPAWTNWSFHHTSERGWSFHPHRIRVLKPAKTSRTKTLFDVWCGSSTMPFSEDPGPSRGDVDALLVWWGHDANLRCSLDRRGPPIGDPGNRDAQHGVSPNARGTRNQRRIRSRSIPKASNGMWKMKEDQLGDMVF